MAIQIRPSWAACKFIKFLRSKKATQKFEKGTG